jgi:prevent-host-death family protein
MDVGIRELKQHLSAYLERAANGEVIQITERGRPKATLGPVPTAARIELGIGQGWISAGNGQSPPVLRRRYRAVRPLDDVLEEDRGE